MAYADDMSRINRRRMLAQALMQRGSQPQGQMVGGIYVGPTALSTIGQLGSIAGGAFLDRKLAREEKTTTEAERNRLNTAMRGLMGETQAAGPATPPNGIPGTQGPPTPGGPSAAPLDSRRTAALSVLQGLPLDQMQALIGQQAVANLFPKPKELKQVDLGGEIGWSDDTGAIVRRTPKSATPQGDTTNARDYAKAYPQNDYPGGYGKWLADQRPDAAQPKFRTLTPEEVVAAGLPPGTSAQRDEGTGKIDLLSKRDNTGSLSQKDATTARMKLNTVGLARQQLNRIRDEFAGKKDPQTGERTGGLQNSWSAGPFGFGRLPSEQGRKFDAAVNQMRSTLTALTRVPGVGAMSDYETKLDQAKFPSRGDYESVTQQQINDLDDMLSLIETGYRDVLGGTQSQAAPTAPVASRAGGVGDDPLGIR